MLVVTNAGIPYSPSVKCGSYYAGIPYSTSVKCGSY